MGCPGNGMAERSKVTRKISAAFPNAHMDAIRIEAASRGCSTATIIREAVAQWVKQKAKEAAQ